MSAIMEVRNLEISFKQRSGVKKVVRRVNFSVSKGKILGIAGESGCGKSMTSLAIMGLLPENGYISGGSITLEGRELTGLSDAEMSKIRAKDIAMIFQDSMSALNPTMTVGRQLAEPMVIHGGMTYRAAGAKVVEMMENVGISDAKNRYKSYPHQFSGGMRQRIMIAMAMALKPKILIADEPTTALDVTVQAQILRLMRDLSRESGTAIIFITHDMGVIAELSDDVLIMYAGMEMEHSDVKSIFKEPKHPYTKGLLASIPDLAVSMKRLPSIEGQVEIPDNNYKGCLFYGRCRHRFARCEAEIPSEKMVGKSKTACFLYED